MNNTTPTPTADLIEQAQAALDAALDTLHRLAGRVNAAEGYDTANADLIERALLAVQNAEGHVLDLVP